MKTSIVLASLATVLLLHTTGAFAQTDLDQYAAGCMRERAAAGRFYQFKGQVLEDQNALKDLGIARTADQLESTTKRMHEEYEQMKDFEWKKQLLDLTFDQAANQLKAIGMANQKVVMSQTAGAALLNQVRGVDPQAAQTLLKAFEQGIDRGSNTITFGGSNLVTLANFAAHANDAVDNALTAQEITKGEMNSLDASFKTAEIFASFLGPEVSKPLKAAHQLADLARFGLDYKEVHGLLALNDAQLATLANLTQQLKLDADRLRQSRLDLQQAQAAIGGESCDSTKLVVPEPAPPPEPAPIAAPVPTATPDSAPPKHSSVGKAVLWSAVAGGGTVAALAAANAAKNPNGGDCSIETANAYACYKTANNIGEPSSFCSESVSSAQQCCAGNGQSYSYGSNTCGG